MGLGGSWEKFWLSDFNDGIIAFCGSGKGGASISYYDYQNVHFKKVLFCACISSVTTFFEDLYSTFRCVFYVCISLVDLLPARTNVFGSQKKNVQPFQRHGKRQPIQGFLLSIISS